MSSALDTGAGTIRDITGICDWCGDECHPNQEICAALSCHRCDSKLYHQNCVEKYLKKMGLASNRKSGFPCPFGKGKGSKDECKGKVEKSHPIVPKNEDKKKARMAPQMLEAMAKQPKQPKPAPAKPPGMPRKSPAPPKAHQLASASRSVSLQAGVWGQGAGPVLANAHLPPPDPEAAAAAQPRPAELPVGLVLEEALSKAQKKNMARKRKRQAAAGLEAAVSEASSDHQENVAAAGASAGAGSATAALVGFDGAAFNAQNTVLEQQGHRFITNAAQYAALLGLYMDDSEDEEEEEEVDAAEEDYADSGDAEASVAAGFSPDVVPAPFSPEPVVPAAPPMAAQPPAVAKDIAGDEAAFDAAVTASIRQFQLEEEMRCQREVLTNGFGVGGGVGGIISKPAAPYPYPGVVPVQAPVVAPVVAPVAVPVAEPVAAPLAAPPPGPSALYGQTKQQPDVPAAHYINNSWVFGGGNQGQALPPHMPSAYATTGPAYGGSGQYGAMAAGHSAPEVAAEDDDDDLSTLLALCGVAG